MEAHQLVDGVDLRLGGDLIPHLDVRGEPLHVAAARRGLDLIVSGLLLLLAAPILIGLWLAVRFDSPGAGVFSQRRVGLRMRTFTLHKFRTMSQNCNTEVHQRYIGDLIGGSADKVDGGHGEVFKLAGDSRVTRIGRSLRRWSLDELPQLWDVLVGRMSLVGPRPVVPYELDHYPEWYFRRFAVKPGMTGLWQVSGRNERTYEEMVRLDIEYVERRSLRLDIEILVKTFWVVATRRGAA